MNILVLQGPHFNLLGLQSAKTDDSVTLDKVNKALRRHAHNISLDISLRFLQTHKASHAISFIQRNRNKATGIIIAPASWGRFEYSILESLKLTGLTSVQVLLAEPYLTLNKEQSIFSDVCNDTQTGHPMTVFNSALDSLLNRIS